MKIIHSLLTIKFPNIYLYSRFFYLISHNFFRYYPNVYRCHKHICFKHMMTATLIDKLNTINIKIPKNIIVAFWYVSSTFKVTVWLVVLYWKAQWQHKKWCFSLPTVWKFSVKFINIYIYYLLFKLEINFQFEHRMSKNRQHFSVFCFIMNIFIRNIFHSPKDMFEHLNSNRNLTPSLHTVDENEPLLLPQGLNK